MSNGVTASASASVSRLSVSNFPSKSRTSHCYSSTFVNARPFASSDSKPKSIGLSTTERTQRRRDWICNSSGDNESKSVLDAFFLGKAIGEALTERIESTVGEILSTIGRLQSEQQKQVQDFQEEVLERAKRAKERAAREAMEAQGLISQSVTIETTPIANGITSAVSPSTSDDFSPLDRASSPEQSPSAVEDQNPVSWVSNGD